MDLSILIKFIHVAAAILWLGGGFALVLVGSLRARQASAAELAALVRIVSFLAPRLFMPASVITLGSGLALVFLAGWGWQAFTVLGLAGIVFTALFGMLVLGPSAEAALALADSKGADAAVPDMRRIFRLARFDYAVQGAIVFLMVAKPGWGEVAVLSGLGAVVMLAAVAALRPVGQPA